jgi:hypothetical protein
MDDPIDQPEFKALLQEFERAYARQRVAVIDGTEDEFEDAEKAVEAAQLALRNWWRDEWYRRHPLTFGHR